MSQGVIYSENDVYVSEAFKDKNFKDYDSLFVGRYKGNKDIYRTLIKFDLSVLKNQISQCSKINSAFIRFAVYRNEIYSEDQIYLYRNISDYSIDDVTWESKPKILGKPDSVIKVYKDNWGVIEINITELLKDWLYGKVENYGITLTSLEKNNGIIGLRSSKCGDSKLHPKLIVNLTNDFDYKNELSTFDGLYKYKYNYFKSFVQNELSYESKQIIDIIKNRDCKGYIVYPQAVFFEPIQRPQQILRELAKRGYMCFFCNPSEDSFSIKEVEENLFVVNQEAYLLPCLKDKSVIVLISWLMQMAWADHIENKFIWYDILDRLDFFTMYDEGMLNKNKEVIEKADFLSYSSEDLKEYIGDYSKKAVLIPNACRIEDFINSSDRIKSNISFSGPVIGYFGAIEEWFDTELICSLADRNPHWNFVIIGKIGIDKEKLKKDNIYCIGPIPYKELSSYANSFDVSIIPFKVNALTNSVSPIKFFEYCALGIPVISTPIKEMKKYDFKWLKLAENTEEFENSIKECLLEDVKNTAIKEGKEFAGKNSWKNVVDIFEKSIRSSIQSLRVYANRGITDSIALYTATFLDFDAKNSYVGGAERYIVDLNSIINKMGKNMVVYQCGNYPWVRRYDNFDIVSLSDGKLNARVFTVEALIEFTKAFYRNAYGRTILNIYSPFSIANPYSVKPCIGISHGVSWDNKASKYTKGINSALLDGVIAATKNCNRLISVDTNTPNFFQTIDYSLGNKIETIFNYVDTDKFKPRENFDITREKIVILYPRRLYEARGFYLVLDIMDSILQNYNNVEFHFVGRGNDSDIKKAIEKVKKWEGRVFWYYKSMDEMSSIYKNADITIIPTLYSEGTSLSCIEAMASGNAVIGTRIGGIPDLITDGYNGYLIEPNSIALKEAIEKLINDRENMISLKRKALETAQAFSKEKWQLKWYNVFNSFIKNNGNKKEASKLVLVKVSSENKLFSDDFLNYIFEHLKKGNLIYIKLKDNIRGSYKSFGNLQFLKWSEEVLSKIDITIEI